MTDRFDSMAVFVEVVEAGSLSAAGRKLGIPLSTVSRKIAELESGIKTRLLVRSTRTLALTDAGKTYLEACKRILEDVAEAERAASGEYRAPRGELVITAPIVFGRLHVLPIVTEFLSAYPDVAAQLVLGDRVLNLLEEQVDVAVRIGELPDSSLVAARVGSTRGVVCANPGYLRRRGVPQHPRELAAHDCVTFGSLTAGGTWPFTIDGSVAAVPIRSRLSVTTAEAAVDAAIAGAGLTRVLSYQIERALEAGEVATVLQEFETASLPINLLHAGPHRMPIKLRAFLDFAAPKLRAVLRGR
jgi:DNA-binding transcriptional LysR family regulator